jgi:hypothetical protein
MHPDLSPHRQHRPGVRLGTRPEPSQPQPVSDQGSGPAKPLLLLGRTRAATNRRLWRGTAQPGRAVLAIRPGRHTSAGWLPRSIVRDHRKRRRALGHPPARRAHHGRQDPRHPGPDIDPMFAVQAPGMLAHIPGTSPIAGEWTSREALGAAVRSLGALGRRGQPAHLAPRGRDRPLRHQRPAHHGRPPRRAHARHRAPRGLALQDGACVELWDHFQDLDAWDAFWR